jgi:hypothetical protein
MNERPLKAFVFRKYPPEPWVQSGDNAKHFYIREDHHLRTLKYWLLTLKYNTFIESLDARGNTALELIYDYEPGVQHSRRRKERGMIVVWEKSLVNPAAKIILNHMTLDNEYSLWLRDAQIEKYS